MDGVWKFVERGLLVIGFIVASFTLYYTAASYYEQGSGQSVHVGGAAMTPPVWVICLGLIGMALLVTGWVMITTRKSGVSYDEKIKQIWNQSFKNETVLLDGIEYIRCTFDGVTFRYEGKGPTRLTDCNLVRKPGGQVSLLSNNPAIKQTFFIMSALNPVRGSNAPEIEVDVRQDETK
jgi:hypothetical protein